jgi:CHASE3 domain sensor protein
MNKNLSLKNILVAFFVFMAWLPALSLAGLAQIAKTQREASAASAARYQSYLLADELRRSSDDLTRLARTYVVTGDPSYEKQYFDILALVEQGAAAAAAMQQQSQGLSVAVGAFKLERSHGLSHSETNMTFLAAPRAIRSH